MFNLMLQWIQSQIDLPFVRFASMNKTPRVYVWIIAIFLGLFNYYSFLLLMISSSWRAVPACIYCSYGVVLLESRAFMYYLLFLWCRLIGEPCQHVLSIVLMVSSYWRAVPVFIIYCSYGIFFLESRACMYYLLFLWCRLIGEPYQHVLSIVLMVSSSWRAVLACFIHCSYGVVLLESRASMYYLLCLWCFLLGEPWQHALSIVPGL